MNTIMFILVALTASTPIAATVLVSIASRREDNERTLGKPKVGSIQMIARRIVGFHSDSHHPRQSPERARAWRADSARTPAQPTSSPDRRRKRPAEPSSRLLATSR